MSSSRVMPLKRQKASFTKVLRPSGACLDDPLGLRLDDRLVARSVPRRLDPLGDVERGPDAVGAAAELDNPAAVFHLAPAARPVPDPVADAVRTRPSTAAAWAGDFVRVERPRRTVRAEERRPTGDVADEGRGAAERAHLLDRGREEGWVGQARQGRAPGLGSPAGAYTRPGHA